MFAGADHPLDLVELVDHDLELLVASGVRAAHLD